MSTEVTYSEAYDSKGFTEGTGEFNIVKSVIVGTVKVNGGEYSNLTPTEAAFKVIAADVETVGSQRCQTTYSFDLNDTTYNVKVDWNIRINQ